ncbi:tRNA pseudouridine(38-40) synthase TruA [Desulfurispira natronophila]|uniref:tRNA pseudouridine synthase A n=1 Tax=Desulfurispira natronophila TaxID=682562 RepID=A0A7W7Y3X4_9BACT|nr:tRNA pseudouridine(38-40) synthase TruA [Desulfurispira natronophila]MBB5021636.1 tRNA pseudouridine38-40 synthase [Desulfurispira natronophila]
MSRPQALRRLVLKVAYDGTNYNGWQMQENTTQTIQSLLEMAASKVCNHKLTIHGSGRTDSGVHARAQICHLDTSSTLEPYQIIFGINSILPRDIRVRNAFVVDDEFHSQFSPHSKKYSYTILHGCPPDPLQRLYSWHMRHDLDAKRLQSELDHFVGEHDFRAFRAKNSGTKTTVRTVYAIHVEEVERHKLIIHVHGGGFLKHMIRIMVGTAVDRTIGTLQRSIPHILAGRDRTKGGRTAPASGLIMDEVIYDAYDFREDFRPE